MKFIYRIEASSRDEAVLAGQATPLFNLRPSMVFETYILCISIGYWPRSNKQVPRNLNQRCTVLLRRRIHLREPPPLQHFQWYLR